MTGGRIRKGLCFAIAGLLMWTGFPAAAQQPPYGPLAVEADTGTSAELPKYSDYLQSHEAVFPEEIVSIAAENYSSASDDVALYQSAYSSERGILTGAGSTVTYAVTVPVAGFYSIEIKYETVAGYGGAIEWQVEINGETPFWEAQFIRLDRVFEYALAEDAPFPKDPSGNENRPAMREILGVYTTELADSTGYQSGSLFFYFPAGKNNLTLKSLKEPVAILALMLRGRREAVSDYKSVRETYPDSNWDTQAEPIVLQAERPARLSSTSILAGTDRTSPITEPQSSGALLLNVLGGESWKSVGQWVEWDFHVPTAGYYQISARFLQNVNIGFFASRAITIDGKLPFSEAGAVRFPYGRGWQNAAFGGEDGAYCFYLTEGDHTLRLTVVLGEMAGEISEIEDCVAELNAIYREILFITGANADPYRMYNFEKLIPDVIERIRAMEKRMADITARIIKVTERANATTALMQRLTFQLGQMCDDPDGQIAPNFSSFKTNIGALASNLALMRQQPLQLDSISITPYGTALPKAEAGLLKRIGFSLSLFISTFTHDYSAIGSDKAERSVKVWLATGRDQAGILRQMISDTFTPERNIGVNLQLVPAGTLLPAVLSGSGPDVSMFNDPSLPVDYAVRGAVEDLSAWPDFESVAGRFSEAAIIPFSFGGHVYGLPETQTVPMMFYRTDIFQKLGIAPPQTWDDFYGVLSVLHRHNMNAGYPMDVSGLCIQLYQRGGQLYSADGTRVLLDTNEGLAAFKQTCELFTKYKLPVSYVFVDRFRSGEMPIAIQDYSVCTQLMLSAPEIKGLWKMVPIPGVRDADGHIHNQAPTSGTAVIMLSGAKDKEAAWEYLKWWTSADTQRRFSKELSDLLGEETFYPTANLDAFGSLRQFTAEEQENIYAQRKALKAIPNVPGGYYLSRYLSFAYLNAYNGGIRPTDAIMPYIEEINYELIRKQEELKLLR